MNVRPGTCSGAAIPSVAAPRAPAGRRPLTRRRLLGLGTGGLLLGLGGCGNDDPESVSETEIVPDGTPTGFVPGFDDPARWAGRTVRVGAWGGEVQDALRDAIWRPFAEATGCTIAEVTTDYSRLTQSINRRETYADLLVVDPMWAATAYDRGFAAPLDDTVIDVGAADIIAGSEHSIPAYAYAMVSAYRWDDIASGPPQNWAEWWDRERFPGDRALWKGPLGTFEFALMADGVEPDQLYPLDGERAIEMLREISGAIIQRWWESGQQPVTWLSRSSARFASAWHYRVAAGQADARPIDLVWNQGLLLADHWVVPVGAPAPDVAMDLIRYATTAEVQAALARLVPLGPVNSAAFDLIEPRTALMLPTAPGTVEQLVFQDVAWWAAHNGEANQQFNNWLLGVAHA